METSSNDVPCKEAISRNLSEPSELDITLSESDYLHIDMLAQPNQKDSCITKFSPNLEYSGDKVVISNGIKKQSQIRAEVQIEEVISADSALAFDKEIALIKADVGKISSLKNSSSNDSEKSFSYKLSNSISPSSDDVICGLSTASVVNGSIMSIKETNASKIENATGYSYFLRSSSGSRMSNDSDYCSNALKHLRINRNLSLGNHIQSTPNKKRSLTSSVISSYHLRIHQDTRKIPLTPPIIKFSQKPVSGRSGSSSVKHSSNPDFECFRIDENTSISDVNDHAKEFDPFEEHISHGDRMKLTHEDTVTVHPGKIKIEVKIDPDSVQYDTEASAYLSHTTIYAVNRKSKMDNENVDIKYPVRKAGLSLRNRSSKPRISGKSSELSKSRGNMDKLFKPSKIVSRISSFSPLVHKPQLAAAPMKGRKDIKVKALEAAELSKRLEEKKQNERESRKAAAKLEREKLHQENSRLLELKQKQKEDEKKKKDAEAATKKRQREEEKGREQKRRCFGKTSRQKDEIEKMLQPNVAKKESMAEDIKGKLPKKSGMQHNIVNALTVDNRNQKPIDIGKMLSMPKGLQEVPQTMISDHRESREQSYELSPYTNSDDEDEEEEARRRHKFVPLWARRESMDRIILSKYQLDPAEIFSRKRSFIVNEVLQLPTVLQPKK